MRSPEDLNRQPVTIRSATVADLRDTVSLRQARELADSGMVSTTAEKLVSEWEALGDGLGEWVWVAVTADSRLLACVELARVDNVFQPRLWVLPDHHDTQLELALLAVAEDRACAIGREGGMDRLKLFAQATSSHPEAREALAQSGYTLLSTYVKMELALNELPAPPQDIPGIEMRRFAAGQDAEPIYRADEEAFIDQRGHTARTFEQWMQRLKVDEETFDSSVWLIAYDGDEIAGAALGEIANGVGWIHHLFVRRPWRRRGLGAALMLSVLGSFYRHGVEVARLNVDADSLTNAKQLYRRLGFQVTGEYSNHEKLVPLT